jgi:hypothetical protein
MVTKAVADFFPGSFALSRVRGALRDAGRGSGRQDGALLVMFRMLPCVCVCVCVCVCA